jgi:hypothetical protein
LKTLLFAKYPAQSGSTTSRVLGFSVPCAHLCSIVELGLSFLAKEHVRSHGFRKAGTLPASISFKGIFLPHGDKNNSSATHTKDFCEKSLPKLPGFEGKNSEITIFGQYATSGCQNIAGFLNISSFFSDPVAKIWLIPLVDENTSVATPQN